jgi:hypothetical protein
MKRIIFVVSRNQPELVPRLKQECRGGNIEIVVDRRFGERRRKAEAPSLAERRRTDRRIHPNASELDLIGVSVVVLNREGS